MICEKQAKSFAEKKKNYKELFYQFRGFLLHSETLTFSRFHLRRRMLKAPPVNPRVYTFSVL